MKSPSVFNKQPIETYAADKRLRNDESEQDYRVSRSEKKTKVHDTVSKELANQRKGMKNKQKELTLPQKIVQFEPPFTHFVLNLLRLFTTLFNTGVYKTAEHAARDLRGLGLDICSQTVRNLLKSSKFQFRRKPTALPLTHSAKKARLQFAKKYKDWTEEGWKGVVLSDETKISRLGSDGGSILLWSCLTVNGVGYITQVLGSLDSELYCKIMTEDMLPSLEEYDMSKDDIIFQHDNDPKHTSRLTQKWFVNNKVQLLDWPAYSPDLNPMENLWDYLKVRLYAYETAPLSMKELFERVADIWYNEITKEYCVQLVCSMPQRLQLVLKEKGCEINY
ncbi:hypothetical protein G6F54_011847 [Rhizopus delemar]|nr:hypothetical protein G6F54_011847 [Rhizopus delemar]